MRYLFRRKVREKMFLFDGPTAGLRSHITHNKIAYNKIISSGNITNSKPGQYHNTTLNLPDV